MGSDLQTRRRSALSGRLTSITVVPAWRAARVNPRPLEEVSSTPTAVTVPWAFRDAIAAAYPAEVVGNSASETWPPGR